VHWRRAGEETRRDIDSRSRSNYDSDKFEHRRRDRDNGWDTDYVRRDPSYLNHDIRETGDAARKIDHDYRDLRYSGSNLDRSDRRREHRSDKELDYICDKGDSSSSPRKYSSSGSSRQHFQELSATRIADHEVSIRERPSSSVGLSCRIPGLWFVKVGLKYMDVVNMTFDVDAEVASQCRSANDSGVTVRLVSLPTASVEETYKKLDAAASRDVVTNAMRSIDPLWPPKGKIIIEVNPGNEIGRCWLPQDLDPTRPPLELTGHIRSGKNCVRLIQLGDLSDHTFLLLARKDIPSTRTPNLKSMSTEQQVANDWDNHITRLKVKPTMPDVRGDHFNFFGTVAVQPQTVI